MISKLKSILTKTHKAVQGMEVAEYVIGILIAFIFVAYLLPVAVNEIANATFPTNTNIPSGTSTLFFILPLLAVIGVVVVIVRKLLT
jgi:hypothetical protein